jgi:hypothetical protein
VPLSRVLSDLSGVSGRKIIQAILEGERDPWAWAAWVEPGGKATLEDIAKSWEGNWRKELLFVLRQEVELYVDKGMEYYEAKYREQQTRSLMKRALKLGFQLVAPETA